MSQLIFISPVCGFGIGKMWWNVAMDHLQHWTQSISRSISGFGGKFGIFVPAAKHVGDKNVRIVTIIFSQKSFININVIIYAGQKSVIDCEIYCGENLMGFLMC